MPITYPNGRVAYAGRVIARNIEETPGNLFALVYRTNETFLMVRHHSDDYHIELDVEVDADDKVRAEASIARMKERFITFQETLFESGRQPERGRKVRFVKEFHVNDFLNRVVEPGATGTCFWVGANRLRKGRKYIGVVVDNTDIRVYVDESFVEGISRQTSSDRLGHMFRAITEQEPWEIPWREIKQDVNELIGAFVGVDIDDVLGEHNE